MSSRNNPPGAQASGPSDVILPMNDPYMGQIIAGTKTYEFRKYLLKPTIKRIWFYRTAPIASITHVCEILPARTRNPGDAPLEEDGLGNKEFNARHKDWDGYDYAYKIVSVYELVGPVTLAVTKSEYGFKAAPRAHLPEALGRDVHWDEQKKIL